MLLLTITSTTVTLVIRTGTEVALVTTITIGDITIETVTAINDVDYTNKCK